MSVSIAGKGSPIGYDRGIALLAEIKKLLGEEVVVTDQNYIDVFSTLISGDEYQLKEKAKNKEPLKGGSGFSRFNFIKNNVIIATPRQVAHDISDFYLTSGFKSIAFEGQYAGSYATVNDIPDSWEAKDQNGVNISNYSYTLTV